MRDHVAERAEWLRDLIDTAQRDGEFDPALSRDAMAHFCLLLGLGSALLPVDAHPVDPAAWNALLARVIAAVAPATPPRPRGAAQ
jgi:hypothetical protein